jgi:hypothetical protein
LAEKADLILMPPAKSILARLFQYQKERFPLAVHIPLIAAFSFSAIGYSRSCRKAEGFIDWKDYMACVLTNIIVFFILRVSDEYKDKEEDALYRKHLPVPRGLITLKELAKTTLILFIIAATVNIIFYPTLLPLFFLAMGYMMLMRYEFFIADWLKRHQVAYIVSHMFIIPLADIYASSYDWKLNGVAPPMGLICFFIVSYLNGMVLEIGRKIRTPETEETGVLSYTNLWGLQKAPVIWIAVLTTNLLTACMAASYASHSKVSFFALGIFFILSALPAVMFLVKPTKARSKWIEFTSLVWALGMYLILGGIPQFIKLST